MDDQQKVVFLDRDGVLIHDVHYLSQLEDIQFYPDVPDGLKRLQRSGFLLVVITNQSGVARGYFPPSFVSDCHARMNQILASNRVTLDHLYFCPHYHSGSAPYNIDCECRKPAPGMIFRARRELNLSLQHAYMIGDKMCDVELAHNADITGILLTTGQGREHQQPVLQVYPSTPVFSSFSQAVDYIISSTKGRPDS
ncbi:HAD family hydrolase [bacterium]|nr:HAD family hydrolase [bacterium]